MMSRFLFAAGLAAGLLVPAANAATVINADSASHTVVASHKDGKKVRLTLAGHHHGRIKCAEGTTLSLGKSSMACHATTAKVFIKNGKLVL